MKIKTKEHIRLAFFTGKLQFMMTSYNLKINPLSTKLYSLYP